MDTRLRTIVKALCWQLIGLAAMTVIGLWMTGSLALGGSIALMNATIGLAIYVAYERLWAGIAWGQVAQGKYTQQGQLGHKSTGHDHE